MSISDRLDQIEGRCSWANSTLTARHMLIGKDVPDLVATVRAVLDLHKPSGVRFPFNDLGDEVPSHGCGDCMHVYPCPTVRAISTALGVKE